MKLQFKVISKKADVGRHLEKLRECMQQEPEPRCRELQKDYYSLIRRLGWKNRSTSIPSPALTIRESQPATTWTL